jgi:DDE domain
MATRYKDRITILEDAEIEEVYGRARFTHDERVHYFALTPEDGRVNHPTPRVINTDGHSAYPPAIVRLKAEGVLERDCRHRPVPYLNNVLEQDHRAIKRRINASQHFRSFWGAWRTIAGYEAIHMIRKSQACGSAPSGGAVLLHHFIVGIFGIEV